MCIICVFLAATSLFCEDRLLAKVNMMINKWDRKIEKKYCYVARAWHALLHEISGDFNAWKRQKAKPKMAFTLPRIVENFYAHGISHYGLYGTFRDFPSFKYFVFTDF